MDDESYTKSLWYDVRSSEPNLALRIALSVIAGLGYSAAAAAGAWAFARLSGNRYVRDEYVVAALLLAGVAWVATLIVIWSRLRRGRYFTVPALITLGISVVTIGTAAAVDEFMSGDEEVLVAAVLLAGLAVVLLVWLPTMQRLLRGRPVVGRDNLVRVKCPECGYSLIGLRDLRCPECGATFTIDELIRAQHYGGVPEVRSADVNAQELPRIHATLEGETGSDRAERGQV